MGTLGAVKSAPTFSKRVRLGWLASRLELGLLSTFCKNWWMLETQRSSPPAFFWLHIKKAGGQSIRAGLSPHYVETDRKTVRALKRVSPHERNDWINSYRQDFGRYDAHRMQFARDVAYQAEEFEAMFKFSFVRNPWDRAVSIWLHMGERKRSHSVTLGSSRKRFKDFLRTIPSLLETSRKFSREAWHAAPALPDLTDVDGQTLLVDFVGRLEHFQRDFDHVCRTIGFEPSVLPHKNRRRLNAAGPIQSPSHYFYDAESRRLVQEIYAGDIEFFEYRFDELEAERPVGQESSF